ncbi:transcription termination factor 2, mitochondrial-like [Clupea harengus]|uniref:Transcription termination factor 2, mitochondrial-like n=1 Tax=Clupea harengus TaxID=7950 RepID=A0A6P3VXC4_CLUHA|nr:transcription termination factor 2, mitochondrial-like [Clupea harengus]
MFRATTASLCAYCHRLRLLPSPGAYPNSTLVSNLPNGTLVSNLTENQHTVDSLYDLSVDIRKVRKFKGWVLFESPTYVRETASLLRDMGADTACVARVLETHPEAILCQPADVVAQRDLWASVCPNQRELVGIIEKFPASFFSVTHYANQRANIRYLQSLRLSKRIIGKLIASAPQTFSRPVGCNQEVIHTLRETYLDLGGDEGNLRVWLQKLLSQNPFIMLRPADAWRDSLGFLHDRGFTTEQLLQLVSSLRACISELDPAAMQQAMDYTQGALECSDDELRDTLLRCPALLYYSVPVLAGRFSALLDAGLSTEQVRETPNVLELTTQIVMYRIGKLASYGYDVRFGSLDVIVGTKKDFEESHGRLKLRTERPLFNPVAPLRSSEE